MKIAINGYFLTRPYTGLGNYTRGLLSALSRIKTDHQFFVFTPEPVKVSFGDRLTIKVLPTISRVGPSIGKFWWEQWQLPKAATQASVDLLHQFYPATSVLTRLPQITSIHDATPWHFPDHNYSRKIRWFRQFTRQASRKAKVIITVSQAAKADIAQIFDLPETKITVIYNGVDELFREQQVDGRSQNILARYKVSFPYLFYVGGFEIHKNVRRLFLAYTKAVSEIREHLVLAGGVFSKTRPPVYQDYYDLPKLIDSYRLGHRVHLIGPVSEEDLPALYQAASLFVSPSLAEGFNIPLVEAMASKVPIICSDIPVNHEIAIDQAGHKAALFVDPDDETKLANAIVKLLHDQPKQQELIGHGWQRQKEFAWEKSARQLLEVYEKFET